MAVARDLMQWPATVQHDAWIGYRDSSTTATSLKRSAIAMRATASSSKDFAVPQREPLDYSWVNKALTVGPTRFDVDRLVEIVGSLEAALRTQGFDVLSVVLSNLPFDRISPQVTVTALRVTSVAREKIPKWDHAVSAAAAAFDAKGIDSARVLRGLL